MKFLRQALLVLFLATLGTVGAFSYSKTVRDHGNSIVQELNEVRNEVTNNKYELTKSQAIQKEHSARFTSLLKNINTNLMSIDDLVSVVSTLENDVKSEMASMDTASKIRDKALLKNIKSVKNFYVDIQKQITIMKNVMDGKLSDRNSGYDKDFLYNKMLYPTVRIGVFSKINYGKFDSGLELVSMGSGSIIYSKKKIKIDKEGNLYTSDEIETYILTCSHLSDGVYNLSHYEIHIFDYEGEYSRHKADRIANSHSSYGKDLMVLKLRDNKLQYKEADFILEKNIEDLKIGEEVVNVGGGLGERPFPGFGYITGKYIESKGLDFLWQTQAPGIFGNSGGPIFTKDGKQIGVVVRISVTRRGNPMPHMSYFVPPDVIYDWLKVKNLDFILAD